VGGWLGGGRECWSKEWGYEAEDRERVVVSGAGRQEQSTSHRSSIHGGEAHSFLSREKRCAVSALRARSF